MALKDLIAVPHYTLKLPSDGSSIEIRPFLVKEEKILLLAKETKDIKQVYNCIKSVLENCIVSPKNINVNKMCYFDVEYLFLKLRSKSMGEKIEVMVTDPDTQQKFETEIDLEKIYISNLDMKSKKLKLSDSLALEMKYPNFADFIDVSSTLLSNNLEDSGNRIEFILNVLTVCINKVYSGTTATDCSALPRKEIRDFIDTLPNKEFEILSEYINHFPKIEYSGKFKNPTTGNEFPVEVRDFTNFFI